MYIVDPIHCYIIGTAAVVVGIVVHSMKKKRLACWTPVTGTVQNVRRASDGDTSVSVRFTDTGGQLRTASVEVADGDSISLGAELNIAFNPKDPEDAFVRDARDMKLALYIPLIAGLVLLLLGVFLQVTLARAGYE